MRTLATSFLFLTLAFVSQADKLPWSWSTDSNQLYYGTIMPDVNGLTKIDDSNYVLRLQTCTNTAPSANLTEILHNTAAVGPLDESMIVSQTSLQDVNKTLFALGNPDVGVPTSVNLVVKVRCPPGKTSKKSFQLLGSQPLSERSCNDVCIPDVAQGLRTGYTSGVGLSALDVSVQAKNPTTGVTRDTNDNLYEILGHNAKLRKRMTEMYCVVGNTQKLSFHDGSPTKGVFRSGKQQHDDQGDVNQYIGWSPGRVCSRSLVADKTNSIGVLVTKYDFGSHSSTNGLQFQIKCNGVNMVSNVNTALDSDKEALLICKSGSSDNLTKLQIEFTAPSDSTQRDRPGVELRYQLLPSSSTDLTTGWKTLTSSALQNDGIKHGLMVWLQTNFTKTLLDTTFVAGSRRSLLSSSSQSSNVVVAPHIDSQQSIPQTFTKLSVGDEIVAVTGGTIVMVYTGNEVREFGLHTDKAFCFIPVGQTSVMFMEHMQTQLQHTTALAVSQDFDAEQDEGCRELGQILFPSATHPKYLHDDIKRIMGPQTYSHMKCSNMQNYNCESGFEIVNGELLSCGFGPTGKCEVRHIGTRRSSTADEIDNCRQMYYSSVPANPTNVECADILDEDIFNSFDTNSLEADNYYHQSTTEANCGLRTLQQCLYGNKCELNLFDSNSDLCLAMESQSCEQNCDNSVAELLEKDPSTVGEITSSSVETTCSSLSEEDTNYLVACQQRGKCYVKCDLQQSMNTLFSEIRIAEDSMIDENVAEKYRKKADSHRGNLDSLRAWIDVFLEQEFQTTGLVASLSGIDNLDVSHCFTGAVAPADPRLSSDSLISITAATDWVNYANCRDIEYDRVFRKLAVLFPKDAFAKGLKNPLSAESLAEMKKDGLMEIGAWKTYSCIDPDRVSDLGIHSTVRLSDNSYTGDTMYQAATSHDVVCPSPKQVYYYFSTLTAILEEGLSINANSRYNKVAAILGEGIVSLANVGSGGRRLLQTEESTQETTFSLTVTDHGAECPTGTEVDNSIASDEVSCWYGHRVNSTNPGYYTSDASQMRCKRFPVTISPLVNVYWCPNGMPVSDESLCDNGFFNGTYVFTQGADESKVDAYKSNCVVNSADAEDIRPSYLSDQEIIQSVNYDTGCCDIRSAYRNFPTSCCTSGNTCT